MISTGLRARLPRVSRVGLGASILVGAALLGGCAALPLGAVGAAAVSGGANSVAKAGVEFTTGGSAFRTFSGPLEDVHEQVLATLKRLEIKVIEEDRAESGALTVRGEAYGRSVTLGLEPVTPVMTRVKFRVRRHGFGNDQSTATEIIAQLERDFEKPGTRVGVR